MKRQESERCLAALSEALRKLGPYRQASGDAPFRQNDAGLAQVLTEVVLVLSIVVAELKVEEPS